MQSRMEDPTTKGDRFFDFATIPSSEQNKLLLSMVVPRPLAWIVSLDPDDRLNARTLRGMARHPSVGSHQASAHCGQPSCNGMRVDADRGSEPSTGLVLGRLLAMPVREDVVLDGKRHYVDTPKMNFIGRMHGGWYTRASNLFRLERISCAEWKA
jgi:flavin reductase (DIM6/NTAB) family NADH-FMN oxidoreductase RutF